mmetsp:Transcript_18185/g.21763  ORF Transcript_18185/g.21763 Transcript_18185/m.21763 type:complete len:105 (+) Transcript_18185:174-488(+)
MQQENINPRRQSSLIGAHERRIRGHTQREHGDFISALISFRRVLRIQEYHVATPPFSTLRAVANTHNDIADVLDEVILQLNNTDEFLVNKYRTESANHRILGRN